MEDKSMLKLLRPRAQKNVEVVVTVVVEEVTVVEDTVVTVEEAVTVVVTVAEEYVYINIIDSKVYIDKIY